VATARGQIATLLGCRSEEIIFTSGGSESNNLALKGLFFAKAARARPHHHHSGRTPRHRGAVPLPGTPGRPRHLASGDGSGRVDPEDLRRAITARRCWSA
jgi:cysteine desulfurase